MIVLQVAVSVVLLVGAGLLLTSLYRLQRVDPGYRADRVIAAEAFPNFTKYAQPQTAITFNPYGDTVFVVKPSDKKEDKDEKGNARLLAQQVFVTTGPTRGDQVAILKGIEPGTEVVTSGQVKLKNGTPLIVDKKVQPSNNPNPKPQEQ